MKEFNFENETYVLKSDFEKYQKLFAGMKHKNQVQEQLRLLYNQLGHIDKFTKQYDKVDSWTKALQWVLDHDNNTNNSTPDQKLVVS